MNPKTLEKNLIILTSILLLMLAAGCTTPKLQPKTFNLTFEAQLSIDTNNQTVIKVGVHNTGTASFPGDENFVGVIELRNATGNELARAEVRRLEALEPDKSVFPSEMKGKLTPGAYRLIWGASGYGATFVNFTVTERYGMLVIGEEMHTSRSP